MELPCKSGRTNHAASMPKMARPQLLRDSAKPVYQFKRPSARLSASPVHSNDFFGMIGRVGLPQHVPLSLSSANQAIYSVSGEDAAVGPYLLCYESMGGSTASPIRVGW